MNIWTKSFGDKYTDRNSPNVLERAKFFDKIIPKDVKSVHELGCNKGHNLEAINMPKGRSILVTGCEINKKARDIAVKKGLFVTQNVFNADLLLCAGVLMHIHPIDLGTYFIKFSDIRYKYILFIEHNEPSIRTINSRWYKNSMWVMDTGKEFLDRYPQYKLIKKGWVNGKKPKELDYTAPLREGQGFHDCDFFWLMGAK